MTGLLVVAVPGLVAGCSRQDPVSNGSANATPSSPSSTAVQAAKSLQAVSIIAPDVKPSGTIQLSAPIKISVPSGSLSSVHVTAVGGAAVTGTLDTSAGNWTPNSPLQAGQKYQVEAGLMSTSGVLSTVRRTLTATSSPGNIVTVDSISPTSGSQRGNAQPVVIEFSKPVTNQAAVTKALSVKDTDNVTGAWRWLSSTRVDYRPQNKWPVGDHVTVQGNLNGIEMAANSWGSGTVNTSFTINSDLRAVVDIAKYSMTVTQNGKTLKTLKVDTGKKNFESLTGSMVVLDKQPSVQMKSCSVGISCNPNDPEYYDETILSAVQITPSGTYVHGAPWDTQLGKVNSSHGCVHLSAADAKWFYGLAEPGDEVFIKGSGNKVTMTNGDADWNLSWQQWIAPTK